MQRSVEEIAAGFARERRDLGMDWADYLCYVLEVDEEDLNEDGLVRVAAVVAYCATAQEDRRD